jgi:hypothetical protein
MKRTAATPSARWALLFALTLWLLVSMSPNPRPAPLPATAPPQDFSAERAMAHVARIARVPHPVGTAEHDRVRDYVRGELQKLGLESQLQTGTGHYDRRGYHVSGPAENIVARWPGTSNTRAVMLVGHYDSVPTGPGAADDGHAVAVLLETLRALRNSPPLHNDIIFLITDAEERGLLGADLFTREHPWRRDPGVVLNFEARGTGGAALMFETSPGNAWMIRTLQAAVPQAQATSVAYEIYRRMPNDTDLTSFKEGGLAGMNFAFIEHPEFYHRPQDDVAHLDRSSVQEQGRYALSLTRAFGGQDLRESHAGNAVYFPTRLTPLIVYPESWVKLIAWIALLALAASAWLGRHARGRWIAIPLAIVWALAFAVAEVAPGAAYLLEWPLIAGILSYALLVSAPETLRFGWRIAAMLLSPAPVFLLLVPFASTLIVALGSRRAAPILAADVLIILASLSPHFVLLFRPSQTHP